MAEKRVPLTLEPETYTRLLGRAATDGCTVQNVVVAACRGYIGEHQRGRVGHGGRPETMIGGPASGARPSGPTTLDLKIGVNTCRGLEARAARDNVTLHTAITRALREWIGMVRESTPAAPEPRPVLPTSDVILPAAVHAKPTARDEGSVPGVPRADSPLPGRATAALDVEGFVALARTHLEPILGRSGNVLYSGVETLRPGPVYLLGLNPGGDPEDEILRRQTIGSTLDELPTKQFNEWLDKSWRRAGVRTPPGQSLLQRRVQYLLRGLGLDPREVCSANLIFARSTDAASSGFAELAPICWPVHDAILGIVRPSLVVAFGNSGFSPYGYLRTVLRPAAESSFPSGHGDWDCKTFDAGRFRVAGLPHLGRYAVDGRRGQGVVTWLRELLDAAKARRAS